MTRIVALLLCLCSSAALAARLERGNGPEPSTLDAHKCQEVACGNVLRDLYEGLVTEDAQGRLIPGMAERWRVSADGRTWTFVLRPGLRWSNGAPLDAPQVVASFRRAFAPATAAPFAELFDALRNARAVQAGALPPSALGVSAPDARTVVFELTRGAPLPALLTLPIAFPVYLPAVERHGAQHTRPGRLVSNGAYRLVAWTPQAHLEVARNPHFHAARSVAIERVRFHVTEDAAAELQRYAAGDLHLTETVPPQPLPALRTRFGPQLRIAPYLGAFWLGLNLTRPPLRDDPALREALSLAIDRELLVRHVTGFGERPAYGVVPPGIPGHTPAALPWARWTQAQREARARALYRAAGYSRARPLTLELRYNTSTPHRRLALAVAAMWRQVLGVRVRLRNEEWKVFVQNRRQRAITQVFRGGWIADVPDARNFLAAFGSDGPLNWTGYDDPGFRMRLARADAARSEAARNAWLHAAELRLLHAHAVIPLYFYSSKHLVAPVVHGFAPNPLDRHASRWLRLEEAR
ncbi:peptide ABC transporter substrate-binding protein [Vulcaniibacterium gelatinicum]|uniref:peptide ABC transporter substrate-binding protein n=1 Tax=Vulcaniibacterium gelatinicum TaxID=2598725 RepID=UPI0011C9FBE9|nr:peptide ABC transporter substrate-binding protein [Vulcaniibacterium gelatinicum]